MAEKNIHICDRCENYIEDGHLHSVTITISYPSPQSPSLSYSARVSQSGKQREVCLPCAKILEDTLKLDKDHDTLRSDLFNGFKLPQLASDDPE